MWPAKDGKDRHSMSRDTDNSLFINFSLPRLYQQLFTGVASYEVLGTHIHGQIKVARTFRRIEQIKELSRLLLNIPIREYQLIAQYYLVWCDSLETDYQIEALERITEQTETYKSQALSSIAAFEGAKGQLGAAMYFYIEAMKASRTISDYVEASLSIAMIKSLEGFHASALKDIENLIPVIKHTEARIFFNFHNSYAVELGAAGMLREARHISRFVLASPLAHAYPKWQETGRELGIIDCKEPHSYVSLKAMPEPVTKPEAKVQKIEKAEPESEPQTASVLAFPALKAAPKPQKPTRLTPQELAELTENDKRELILAALRSGAIRDKEYDKLMVMAGLIKIGPADKVLDLEDKETLNNIAVEWAHLVKPEELAAVLSAIRDCEDRVRQRNILDRIIRIAFEQTQLCGLTEEAWRLRVERSLPKK
jgi:tetratricopeptide (TPR) repeat protein